MDFAPENLSHLPQSPGVYQFSDARDTILYIGKAINLKRRVSSYFHGHSRDGKTRNLVGQIQKISVTIVQSELEALLLEARLIHTHQPKYNVIWKDDKHALYITITREEFPRILTSRKNNEPYAEESFGPFPSSRTARMILTAIRHVFPYCTQSPHIKKTCFYSHLNLCTPCPAEIRREKNRSVYVALRKRYRRNIRNATAILRGNIRAGKALLSRKMRQFSEKKAYEQAAKVRDTIRGLDGLIVRFHAPESYLSNPILAGVSGRGENRELESILRPTFPSLTRISRIECYDISNISGTLATGSLVTCVDGVPKKEFYRRFRIKTKKTPDDFAMLQEVFTRRLKHTEWQLPDLIIIDGGIPQLTACGKIFQEKDMRIPYIGIAKEYEKLVIPQGRQFRTLLLPQNSPALQAVQRIRDEAHRFAHAYHQTLRRKNLFQSFEKKRKV